MEQPRDPLTGLYSHRSVQRVGEQALARSRATGQPLAILYADIDHCHPFNHHHGHNVGDVLIQKLAAAIGSCLRDGDIAVRYGGDEFLVLASGADEAEAKRLAEEIRQAAKRVTVEVGEQRVGPVTLAIGVAVFPTHGDSLVALLQAADDAVHGAKVAGRDRVAFPAV